MPVSASRSRAKVSAAESLWLSPEAEQDRTSLPAALRHTVNEALVALKNDPDWHPPDRLLAPADSRHHGSIVDLSLISLHVVIVYRLHDHGREVEVIRIEKVPLM